MDGRNLPNRRLLPLLASAVLCNAIGFGAEIKYGVNIHLQNGRRQAYLDVRGEGCYSNKGRVSAAGTRYRSAGSGSSVWAFMSADGKIGPVVFGDRVHLQNQHYNGQTFLDTRGDKSTAACESAVYCVSTSLSSDHDGGSGTWIVTSASGKSGPVSFTDKVHLQRIGSPSSTQRVVGATTTSSASAHRAHAMKWTPTMVPAARGG